MLPCLFPTSSCIKTAIFSSSCLLEEVSITDLGSWKKVDAKTRLIASVN